MSSTPGKKIPCPACQGSGGLCQRCHGTGFAEPLGYEPAQLSDASDAPGCLRATLVFAVALALLLLLVVGAAIWQWFG